MKKIPLSAVAVAALCAVVLSAGSPAQANGPVSPLMGNALPSAYGTALSATDADIALKTGEQKLRDDRRSVLPPNLPPQVKDGGIKNGGGGGGGPHCIHAPCGGGGGWVPE